MKPMFSLLLFSLTLSIASFSEVYICNLDHYQYLTKREIDIVSERITTIFFLSDCQEGKKVSFEQTIGAFKINISCREDIFISVAQDPYIYKDHIEKGEFDQRFSRAYLQRHTGLRINCQGRTLAKTVVDDEH